MLLVPVLLMLHQGRDLGGIVSEWCRKVAEEGGGLRMEQRLGRGSSVGNRPTTIGGTEPTRLEAALASSFHRAGTQESRVVSGARALDR